MLVITRHALPEGMLRLEASIGDNPITFPKHKLYPDQCEYFHRLVEMLETINQANIISCLKQAMTKGWQNNLTGLRYQERNLKTQFS